MNTVHPMPIRVCGIRSHCNTCASGKRVGIATYTIGNGDPNCALPGFDLACLEERLKLPMLLPHRHSFYQIIWITQGVGTHIVDAEHYPIKEGAIFTLAPGQVHAWDISPDSQGHVINVGVDFLHDALGAGSRNPWFSILDDPESCPVFYLSAGQSAVLLDIVTRLKSEHYASGANQANIVQAYLNIFLMKLYQYRLAFHCHRDFNARRADIVKRFRLLVDQNLASGMSIKDYASLLHVTDSYLTKATKRITGATARQLIRERILLEAKRLLIHGGISIAEVAYQLDFKDPSYFSRFFKKSTNQSPKEFKAEFEKAQRIRSGRC